MNKKSTKKTGPKFLPDNEYAADRLLFNSLNTSAFIEIARKHQEEMQKFQAILHPAEKFILQAQNIANQYSDFQSKLVDSITSPALKALQFQTESLKTVQNLEKLLENFSLNLPNIIKTYNENLSHVPGALASNQKLIKLGQRHTKERMFVCPYFTNYAPNALLSLFENDEKPIIDVYHDYFLNPANVEALMTEWFSNPIYQKREKILRSALLAHVEKKYELSIPVLIREFEGILRGIIKKPSKKIQQTLRRVKANERSSDFFGFLTMNGILTEIVCDGIFLSASAEEPKPKAPYPNRHLIQHGYDIDYFENHHYSTRLILIIDFLRSPELAQEIMKAQTLIEKEAKKEDGLKQTTVKKPKNR